ncbi:MAG: ATP-binding protein [Candidatus Ozemobacteraceae bacterium]
MAIHNNGIELHEMSDVPGNWIDTAGSMFIYGQTGSGKTDFAKDSACLYSLAGYSVLLTTAACLERDYRDSRLNKWDTLRSHEVIDLLIIDDFDALQRDKDWKAQLSILAERSGKRSTMILSSIPIEEIYSRLKNVSDDAVGIMVPFYLNAYRLARPTTNIGVPSWYERFEQQARELEDKAKA